METGGPSLIGLWLATVTSVTNVLADVSRKTPLEGHDLIAATSRARKISVHLRRNARWNIFKSGRAFAGLVLLCLALVSAVCDARAQVLYGSVVGIVVDPSQSAVPQAVVRLTNTGTNQSREMTTDDNGNFTFTASSPHLTAEA